MGAPRAEVAIVVALAFAALPANAAPGPNRLASQNSAASLNSGAAGPDHVAASGPGSAGLESTERRIAARPSAARAAAGHAPALACDDDPRTAWLADARPAASNNRAWFTLDAGAVRPLARLHWEAASEPYPAAGPTRFTVSVSRDGRAWRPIALPPARDEAAVADVALHVNARFVRLEVTQVRDGTGWTLGLREAWLTEGRAPGLAAAVLRPQLAARDGALALAWTVPSGYRFARARILAGATPDTVRALATLPGTATRFEERGLANFTPRHYVVEGLDARGATLLRSPPAAGFARPTARAPLPETLAFWYQGYVPRAAPGATVTAAGDTPLLVGPTAEAAAADLRLVGRSVLPYVSYYQTSRWAPLQPRDAPADAVRAAIAPIAFFGRDLAFAESPPGFVPTLFSRPTHIEYDPRHIQYTTCPASVPFRDQVLAHAAAALAAGAGGLFVDNGFRDDVAAGRACESPFHAHAFTPIPTSAAAFLALLLDVYTLIKRQRPDGWLLVNSGVPSGTDFAGLTLPDVSDAELWESFLRTSRRDPVAHRADWPLTHARAIGLERQGARTVVLSYPFDRDEAFFCYATAKLSQLPWAASLGDRDPRHQHDDGFFGTHPELVGARLGRALGDEPGGVALGAVWFRAFEHGLVLVNPTGSPVTATLPLQGPRHYRELYSGTEAAGDRFSAQLPPESGRVLIWR